MSQSAGGTDAPLLFNWAPPKGKKLLISGFLALSFFLHAVGFYVFKIIYPPAVTVLPPPARINLIAANSEEGRTLLRWIVAEDPALASATLRPAEMRSRALPKLEHVPSYMTEEPKLKDAPPLNLLPPTPSAQPPGPAPVPRLSIDKAPVKVPTRVAFSEELSSLGSPVLPASQFAGATREPPENIRFRIAANQQGEVRYCFRLNSSGDSALDEQARLHLVRCRFPAKPAAINPEEQSLVWGVATVEWGNDVAQPAPSPAQVRP
jgi:hypothetical protein